MDAWFRILAGKALLPLTDGPEILQTKFCAMPKNAAPRPLLSTNNYCILNIRLNAMHNAD